MRRARLLARLSTLWALDDQSCAWIVKKAVEARYPKRRYSLGLDLVATKAAAFVPDSVWELSSWVVYERLGGRRCESWMLEYDSGTYWSWLPGMAWSLGMKMLAKCAKHVREKEKKAKLE